jgi:hypothetical protein
MIPDIPQRTGGSLRSRELCFPRINYLFAVTAGIDKKGIVLSV